MHAFQDYVAKLTPLDMVREYQTATEVLSRASDSHRQPTLVERAALRVIEDLSSRQELFEGRCPRCGEDQPFIATVSDVADRSANPGCACLALGTSA